MLDVKFDLLTCYEDLVYFLIIHRKLWSGWQISLLGSGLKGETIYFRFIIPGLSSPFADIWRMRFGFYQIWTPQGTGYLLTQVAMDLKNVQYLLRLLYDLLELKFSGTNQDKFFLRKTWYFHMSPMLISAIWNAYRKVRKRETHCYIFGGGLKEML